MRSSNDRRSRARPVATSAPTSPPPQVSSVTDMSYMFYESDVVNQPMNARDGAAPRGTEPLLARVGRRRNMVVRLVGPLGGTGMAAVGATSPSSFKKAWSGGCRG